MTAGESRDFRAFLIQSGFAVSTVANYMAVATRFIHKGELDTNNNLTQAIKARKMAVHELYCKMKNGVHVQNKHKDKERFPRHLLDCRGYVDMPFGGKYSLNALLMLNRLLHDDVLLKKHCTSKGISSRKKSVLKSTVVHS